MQLEINQKLHLSHNFGPSGILITPPIDEDYWALRVPLTDKQAVVAFPKFCTMGIGFQHEEDWNTNLPFQTDAEAIYKHIEHNKGDKTITKKQVIQAIKMLQAACKNMKEPSQN